MILIVPPPPIKNLYKVRNYTCLQENIFSIKKAPSQMLSLSPISIRCSFVNGLFVHDALFYISFPDFGRHVFISGWRALGIIKLYL